MNPENQQFEPLPTEQHLQSLAESAAATAPWGHRLHDYFLESLEIIRRLLGYAQSARADGIHSRDGQLRDASHLMACLQEEMDVAARSDDGPWRDILVTDHGLTGDGQTDDGPALRRLLDRLEGQYNRLIFPAGTYYLANEPGRSTIELFDRHDLCFTGLGRVTWLCDGRANSGHNIDIHRCRNLTFENITLDNRPTPFTVGKIHAVLDGTRIEIEILPDQPLPDESYATATFMRGRVYDPRTQRMRTDCGDPRITRLEELGGRRYRLSLDDNALSNAQDLTRNFKVGQLFSVNPRQRPGHFSGVVVTSSRHLLFSRVTVHSGELMLFRVNASMGVKFIDCALEPAPGRLVMSNGDGLHCRSNEKGVYVERCRLMGMNDDCLNFYSAMLAVGRVEDDRHVILTSPWERNEQFANLKVGDRIAFLNPNTGAFDAFAAIAELEPIDLGSQKGLIRLTTVEPVCGIVGRHEVGRPEVVASREYTISGADNYRRAMAIDAPFEHMLFNLSAKNDGFIVRNCEMGHNRATGFKCKATNGVIRNTRFHNQAVMLQTEPSWFEGTYPANLLLRDVRADHGIRFQALLPGRKLEGHAVAMHMPNIIMDRVHDAAGHELRPPSKDDPQP